MGRITIILLAVIMLSCNSDDENKVIQENFGVAPDGSPVFLYTMKNSNGMTVKLTNYGATLVSIVTPDKDGNFADIIAGFDSLSGYVNDNSFIGVTVGRYANRIGKGKFKIDDREYQLTINDGNNHLHGGVKGFHKLVWDSEIVTDDTSSYVVMKLHSPDGYEGYPGNVDVKVKFSLNDNNDLIIEYAGTTDKPTILNLTNHAYYNLSGNFENTILDHILTINADNFTPIDSELIPTGEIASVENTPMDFRKPTAVGARINEDYIQLKYGKGYDHNWALNEYDGNVRKAVTLSDPKSGRVLEIFTDQPGMQFYSGNFLNGTITGKGGIKYNYRTALCLEPQFFPDSPNKDNFDSPLLKPGEIYRQTTVYRFGIMK
ncbi:Aldose 1-epimerase [Melioribacter roseus P3M-2]|uniref:Aldose 1-epimerase n=1 Tax=Melioribacter roseus (strain DSM 23840 / JCM 17771 / VKM B-2668 / P3M-2) TaxID=1191523 RepID=I6ZZX1_MELRP|nr:aldose epimerase family protein [Melioribacter roseus]AFN73276.1 Aldose 1-epimerase [Melioribacter roseus P3M-2]